jgi:phage pi2 protein 07
MPSLRNWQLLRALFFTKFPTSNDDGIRNIYEDPAFNQRLAIKRHGRSYHPDDAPEQFKGEDAITFTSYVSSLMNASEEQLKGEDKLGLYSDLCHLWFN